MRWRDRTALGFAAAGLLLMALALIGRVNPVEGGVTADFLGGTALGRAVVLVLIVACTPAWILAGVTLLVPGAARMPYALAAGLMLASQAVLYFLLGTLVSTCVRRIRKKT